MGYRTFGTSGLYVPGLFLAAMTFGELHVALEPVTTARYADRSLAASRATICLRLPLIDSVLCASFPAVPIAADLADRRISPDPQPRPALACYDGAAELERGSCPVITSGAASGPAGPGMPHRRNGLCSRAELE